MTLVRSVIRKILQESPEQWVYNSLSTKQPKPSNKDPYNERKVRFTAVKIEAPGEIKKIKDAIQELGIDIPRGWKTPHDYHMTIQMGAMSLGKRIQDVGQEVELEVNTIGKSDMAIAFGVSGYMSKNDYQHITIAFQVYPADSKFIQNWVPLKTPFTVKGVIREYDL